MVNTCRERVYEHLISDGFQLSIARLAKYTIRQGFEGGLASYADGTSRADLPTQVRVSELAAMQNDSFAALHMGYGAYNPRKLVYKALSNKEVYETSRSNPEADLSDVQRRDIDLFIHSHPVHPLDPINTHRELLRPSLPDLETWEEYDILNPGITAGILVPTDDSQKLLLWRKRPADTLIPRYQLLEGRESAAQVVRVMRESGIRIATTDMLLEDTEYKDQVGAAVEQLF